MRNLHTKRNAALTLVELLVVIVGLAMIVIMFLLVPERNQKAKAYRVQCIYNLKQVGIAYRVSSGDSLDRFLMQVSTNRGGSMEFASGPNAWRHFLVMSNELTTPKVLFCPAESDRARFQATTFTPTPERGEIPFASNSNLSYFAGINAYETVPQMFLAGDHNLTNDLAARNGILEVTTKNPTGWTSEMHNKVGNVCFTDGSVAQMDTAQLQDAVAHTSLVTNRLQMPILGP